MTSANDIQCPACPLSMKTKNCCEIGWLSLAFESENLKKWQGQLITMIIFDCVSLVLDAEQMKLSTTAVKDTEEVNTWKKNLFL